MVDVILKIESSIKRFQRTNSRMLTMALSKLNWMKNLAKQWLNDKSIRVETQHAEKSMI